MAKIYCIKVYLTRPQYEQLKEDAKIKNNTVSRYVRNIIARNNLFIEEKIVENNKILKQLENALFVKK